MSTRAVKQQLRALTSLNGDTTATNASTTQVSAGRHIGLGHLRRYGLCG